jgi:hypothetical protein
MGQNPWVPRTENHGLRRILDYVGAYAAAAILLGVVVFLIGGMARGVWQYFTIPRVYWLEDGDAVLRGPLDIHRCEILKHTILLRNPDSLVSCISRPENDPPPEVSR